MLNGIWCLHMAAGELGIWRLVMRRKIWSIAGVVGVLTGMIAVEARGYFRFRSDP